ncbi:MAG: DNA translocase FtsK [Nitriliruptor sp.]|nr:MAG: DNA translocase FtsK [Nitriliruptor sp.]
MASSTNTRKRTSGGAATRKGGGKATSSGKAKPSGGGSNASSKAAGKGGAASRQRSGRGGGRRGGSSGGSSSGVTSAVAEHLGERRQDIGGLALVVLGVLSGLGTYANAAGPVGDFLEAVALGLVGLVGYVVPVLVTWFGLLVVIGRPAPEVGRIAIGAAIGLSGVLGGLHLLADAPDPGEGMRALWRAGGLLGWAVATPLAWALSLWGAAAVLLALVLLGVLIVTRTPFSRVLELLRSAVVAGRDDDDDDDDDDDPDATAPMTRSSRSARGRGAEEAPEAADAAEEPTSGGTRVRATLAGTSASQPSLAEGLVGDDDPEAADPDGEVAAIPDPPVERARVPGEAVVRKAAKVRPVDSFDDYQLPSLELLAAGRVVGRDSRRVIEAQSAALQETFDQFGIDATVARSSRGPTVTRFEIELGPGVQVKKVANMGDDIAYALAAPDVRIVAPIPGKSAIGVEVPNRQRDLITLGDILRSNLALSDPHPLTVALGVDIAGEPEMINLATMPHLLVSGATGSGKSVTLNGMISSIVMRARPDQVRMILIDPKRVELNAYEGAPHLLSPVVTDPRRAADAVQWCVKEMEQRYELLAHLGYRNIDGYNEAVAAGEVATRPGPPDEDGLPTELEARPLPYILLVIDELADLMLVAPRDVEDAICRIAQMARAVGIHMIIATQRPSVDVITGLIKANIPSRLALQVASQTDSRTIIDMNGAEKLVGKGDMLFLPASQGKPTRLQGCWVTEREITTAVGFCKGQRQAEYDDRVVKEGEAADQADAERSGDDGSDAALLRRAAEQVVVSGLGSTSMLQRKLRIGFARAGRLMDELEELGVVGPNEGSKAREVLWSPEELDEARSHNVL